MDESVQDRKTDWGSPITILGLRINVTGRDMVVTVCEKKRIEWLRQIDEALNSGRLPNAEKLGGRLSFAATHTFQKLGRAVTRVIISHARSG